MSYPRYETVNFCFESENKNETSVKILVNILEITEMCELGQIKIFARVVSVTKMNNHEESEGLNSSRVHFSKYLNSSSCIVGYKNTYFDNHLSPTISQPNLFIQIHRTTNHMFLAKVKIGLNQSLADTQTVPVYFEDADWGTETIVFYRRILNFKIFSTRLI